MSAKPRLLIVVYAYRDHEARIRITQSQAFPHGHAAGLAAIEAAIQQMQQGSLEICLVGGVDSYFQPDTMEWLDENLQLAGAESRSAFVPGEGAGFCLLMTDRAHMPAATTIISPGCST